MFASDVIDVAGSYTVHKDNHYEVITCVKHDAAIVVDAREYALPYTRSVIIPASVRTYEVRGACRVLRSWHPVEGCAE